MEAVILSMSLFSNAAALFFLGFVSLTIYKEVKKKPEPTVPKKIEKEEPTKDNLTIDKTVPLDMYEPDFSKPMNIQIVDKGEV